jgi:endonuclease/exonuclease/phosphatase family metal-dependent hydrolase
MIQAWPRRAFLLLALLVAVPGAQPAVAHGSRARTVTVMTRNLYLGAPLDGVLLAGDFVGLAFAVADVWDTVQDTDFEERAEAVAHEIICARADLVGLQEAAIWRTEYPASPAPATEVAYDFVEILLDELAERGAHYEVVVSQDNLDAELPSITGEDIRFTDRDVILARKTRRGGRLKVLSTDAAHFDNLLALPVGGPGGPVVTILRGWVAADVKLRGKKFRFLNTHLEDGFALIQEATAYELLAGPLATDLPVICLGDFNSDAYGVGTESYEILLAGGLQDAWADECDAGLTWGQAPDLSNTESTLTERLDLILYDGPFRVKDVYVVGDDEDDRTGSGLWPSDHAGVVATFRLLKR